LQQVKCAPALVTLCPFAGYERRCHSRRAGRGFAPAPAAGNEKLGRSAMTGNVYPVPESWRGKAWIDAKTYEEMYARSVKDPNGFWAEQAKRIDWISPPTKIKNTSYDPHDVSIKWYEDGVLNASLNCLDRHLEKRGNQTAILWEGDDPKDSRRVTYKELHETVCRLANAMKSLGIKKGDRVTIYMPMVPEAAAAMLACARIGAIHSVVFGGFSPDSLVGRIQDCDSNLVITADEGVRGGRKVPLKANADEALKKCPTVKHCIVLKRTGGQIGWTEGRDLWWHDLLAKQQPVCKAEPMGAEDPLFILYTSGSTGKPKGVLHTTGGYLVYASLTHQAVFDYRDGEIYWCTADVGWVTGHTYIVYGPLANGAVSLMFEGVPNYPSASRFWEVCDKHKVNIFYTAPTAIRALMRDGEGPVTKTSRASIRLLGTVGEPINPEAWEWYHRVVGERRCPIVDTWWQTETGGILISPLPGATDLKPGSATRPLPGVQPVIVDGNGKVLEGACEGNLCIADSWPGQMRTVFRDHERFVQTYFSTYKGFYFTGDGCRRDADGYYWITGRVDDVINVAGHRLGTAEVESALVAHPKVAESAVVGYPHDIKGQGIYAYVTLKAGIDPTEDLRKELVLWVRKEIGPIATPDMIQWAPGLPKTRSGKIMRRILRKIAENDFSNLGDTSTLADPGVVDDLVKHRGK
jgi:acetyl-CoA synthetase